MPRMTRPSPHSSQDISESWIFIPPNRYNAEIKVNVTKLNGDVINLMSYDSIPYVMNITTTGRSLRKGFGEATLIIQNPQGIFNAVITGGEVINIVAEYTDGTPTNNIFHGRIDGALPFFDMNNGFQMKILCRQVPELQDKFVSAKAIDAVSYSFITQIISDNFSDVLTSTNMSADMTTVLNRNYVFTNGGKVFNDVFDKAGFTGYIDENNDIHSWSLANPQKNEEEFIAWGTNCNAVQPFGTDLKKTKNNIIVTGDRADGGGDLFYIWSKRNDDDIDTYWQKDILLNDNTLVTQESIETDTSLAYDVWTRSDPIGGLSSVYGLETLRPGQAIRCFAPHCNVKDWFVINELTHNITPTNGSWNTSVRIEKFNTGIVDLLKVRDEKTKGNILSSLNPNGMIGGFMITFDEDSSQVAHDNTEVINNQLVLQSGYGNGTATSILKTVAKNIVRVEVRLSGSDLGNSSVDVTVNNEETYDNNIGFNTLNSFLVTASGSGQTQLRFRINLVTDSDNLSPTVESAICMFKYD